MLVIDDTGDRAIRRHWTLVFCTFTFCGWHDALQARSSQSSAAAGVRKSQQPPGTNMLAAPAARRAFMADPGYWLACYWSAYASTPVPAQLNTLLNVLNAGQGINLYLRI